MPGTGCSDTMWNKFGLNAPCDGAKGAAHVAAAGGLVLAQDPATATAPSMPRTIVDEGLAKETAPIAELATITGDAISDLALELQAAARR